MAKEASHIPASISSFGSYGAKNYFTQVIGQLANYAKNNPAVVSGAGIGLLGGAWLGNKAYKAQIPQARALPRLEQRPMIDPYYQNQ